LKPSAFCLFWDLRGARPLPLLLFALVAFVALMLSLAACLPAQVKELNQLGDRASAERKYEQAISYYTQSLTLAPEQDEIRVRLGSAQILLKQIYVTRIYDIVDAREFDLDELLAAWRMSANLPHLKVEAGRVESIRLDLAKRFGRAEPDLRKRTEPHRYHFVLGQLDALVPEERASRARAEVGESLRASHLEERRKADARKLRGLALLHTLAAATFSPRDSGLAAEAERRRAALRGSMAIPLALRVQAAGTGTDQDHLLGGLRRRVPRIFSLAPSAALELALRVRPVDARERQSDDQLSADCKVGSRQEPNPECDSLRRRAESAKSVLDHELQAMAAVSARCEREAQVSSCSSYVSSARSSAESARREYERQESAVSSCPRTVDIPIFKTFFYKRHTIHRQVTVAASLAVSRSQAVESSRGVTGESSAQDTYGDGLSCAHIAPDPLQLASLASLRVEAEERLLDGSLAELHALRRKLAADQLAGGDQREDRLDALVRARLVDESWDLPRAELSRHLVSTWSSDFGLVGQIVQP
jgi:hypothetical protein